MQRRVSGRVQLGYLLGFALVLSALLAFAVRQGSAKDKPQDECLAEFTGVPEGDENGGTITCDDCDPSCDNDGVTTPNGSCTFNMYTGCVNKPSASCVPATLKKIKGKIQNGASIVITKPAGTDSACAAFTATVKLKKKGKKAGKSTVTLMAMASGKPKRKDKDVLTLICNPQPAATCPTTTTSSTTSTTIMAPPPMVCGDGMIVAPEICDPPFTQGGCPSGQICSGDCSTCMPCSNSSCSCGTPARPSQLKFTTGTPDLGTKVCIGGASPPNTPCVKDQDCTNPDTCSSCPTTDGTVVGTITDDSGATACNLRSGGLYFGGVGVTVPLPASVPDMGSSLTNVGCCVDSAPTKMQLLATAPTDPGASIESCTSGTAADPVYPACVGGARVGKPCRITSECAGCAGGSRKGSHCAGDIDCPSSTCDLTGTCTGTLPGCLFGPPLPIPNTTSDVTSTCVINRVAQDGAGLADCSTGDTQLNLPLTSDIYLTGDLLNGNGGNPDVPGIQPCPLCTGAPGSETCQGGPNNGFACTPGSGALGTAYPTSHDCPPPQGAFLGILPIPFALSTSTQTKIAQNFADTPPGAQFVFCGFCGRTTSPSFEGPPPHPCLSNAECTNAPFTLCAQRGPGAFNVATAQTISSTGVPAGDLTDHGAHSSRLVSIFCIPPAYDPIVDAAADLPGPGAVSLPGTAQILP